MRVKSFFAFLGVVAIPVTVMIIAGYNPLPAVRDWVSKGNTLADPATAWHLRLDIAPHEVTPAGSNSLLFTGDHAYAVVRSSDGSLLWPKTLENVDYAGVAGSGAGTVVVLGGAKTDDRRLLDVRDAGSGVSLWKEPATFGVWTFTDLVITLSCPDSDGCVLKAHAPTSQKEKWSVGLLPISVRELSGLNHQIAGLRSLVATGPAKAPPILGFPVNGKVWLLNTATGGVLDKPASTAASRVVAVGTGVLRIDADYRNGGCQYTMNWTNLLGKGSWHSTDLQPRTDDGAACEQRGDPAADGGLLYVVGSDRRDGLAAVRAGGSGRPLFTTADGERIVAVGGFDPGGTPTVVLVRSADGKTISARPLSGGAELWHETVNKDISVGTDGSIVTFINPKAGELTARQMLSGAVSIRATTVATLLGYAPDGLVLNEARTIGVLRYGAVHP